MASLEIHHGGSSKVYEIFESELIVGSDAGSQIAVRDDAVAARHARVAAEGDRYSIEGIESEIEINGKSAQRHQLEHGDLVRVGPAVLVFLEDGQPKPIVPKRLLGATDAPKSPTKSASTSEVRPPTSKAKRAKAKAKPVVEVASIPSVPTRGGGVRGGGSGGVGAGRTGPQAPVRRSERRAEYEDEPRSSRSRSSSASGSVPKWMIGSLALLGGVAAILILVRVLGATSGPDAESLLNLAEHKLKQGEIAMARTYVDQAEQVGPNSAQQARIREIRAKIDTVAENKASVLEERAAIREFDGKIQRFHANYFVGKEPRRAAARVFVPMLNEWLERHRAVCSASGAGQDMIQSVEGFLTKYEPLAELQQPDNVDDVLFKADRLTRFKFKRDYPKAFSIVDAWLGANPDHERAEDVREKRKKWKDGSRTWFKKACKSVDDLVRAGHVEKALERIEFIAGASLSEWSEDAANKLEEVRALKP